MLLREALPRDDDFQTRHCEKISDFRGNPFRIFQN